MNPSFRFYASVLTLAALAGCATQGKPPPRISLDEPVLAALAETIAALKQARAGGFGGAQGRSLASSTPTCTAPPRVTGCGWGTPNC